MDITCSRCGKTEIVSPTTSKYANTNMKGNISLQNNYNWYNLNLKNCIATLASGLGASNLSELFSFIGIPKAKVLHKRKILVYEYQIGGILRNIAKQAMKEGKMLEVKT